MKLTILLLILLFQNKDFIDKVTSDFNSNGYYLVLNISYGGEINRIAVSNGYLYSKLKSQFENSKTKYLYEIKKVMKSDDTLIINNHIENFIAEKVTVNEQIDSIANLGKEKFLEYFFVKNNYFFVLKKSISGEHKPVIIDKLFHWKILCRIDDESGALIAIQMDKDIYYNKKHNLPRH